MTDKRPLPENNSAPSPASDEQTELQEFANRMASIYARLLEGQEPLGPEFEAVWDEHATELYGANVRLRE